MKRPNFRKRYIFLTFVLLVVGGCALACFLWIRAELRQYAMNRELIDALVHHDNATSLTLVNAGANPNTTYETPPKPSLKDLWNVLFHDNKKLVADDDTATALQITCGAQWSPLNNRLEQEVPELVDAMLQHGGDVKVQDQKHYSLLMVAARPPIFEQTIAVLLKHGANPNVVSDRTGMTPLIMAVVPMSPANPRTVRLLLEHGANVNTPDPFGWSALYYSVRYARMVREDYINDLHYTKEIIQLLIAYDADPNQANKSGDTPLKRAKLYKLTNVIAIMEHRAKPVASGAEHRSNL